MKPTPTPNMRTPPNGKSHGVWGLKIAATVAPQIHRKQKPNQYVMNIFTNSIIVNLPESTTCPC